MKVKSLKNIILVLSEILLFCFSNLVFAQPNIKIQVKVIEKLSPEIHNRFGGTFYSVNIDIFNNTDSVIRFWTMCGWQINWTSNNKNLILFPGPNNDKDYTLIQQINSKEWLSYSGGKINVKGNIEEIKTNSYKLGLILVLEKEMNEVEANDFDIYFDLLDRKRKEGKDIIWSEPFKIP